MSSIASNLQVALKTKTRLVQDEDDRRAAVPPQFADLLFLISALCDWQTPVHAVTGIPVLVYFPRDFFSNTSDDFSVVSLRMLPPRYGSPASFSIRLRDAYYS